MAAEPNQPNPELLVKLVQMKMPFGKYKDRLLCDLPISYLECLPGWRVRRGFSERGFQKESRAFTGNPLRDKNKRA